jgi:molecular chaperone GrpE
MKKKKDAFVNTNEGHQPHDMEQEQNIETTDTKNQETEKMAGLEMDQTDGTEVNEEVAEKQLDSKGEDLQKQVNELQDKYIRLMAEFDNFRKRSLKERMELLKSAGEDVLINILPVIDDFERGLDAIEKSSDIEAVKQGIQLIYNKFKDFLVQRGVKEIDANHQDFNVDMHEAITKIPAPEENLKGKVVDVLQKGYMLNDKVIRYAKVVIGE